MSATVLEVVTPEMLTFLDELREEGVTNMYGARPHLQAAFGELSKKEAGAVLTYWIKTFGERHPKGEEE